jgi:Flp pilus assembly protein TadG
MIKKPATTEKGQSLVEMAITATLLMFLLLATIDFGIAFFYWIAIRDAAEEGAVYGSLHPDATSYDALRTRVKGAASSQLVKITDLPDSQIEITSTGACPGNSIPVFVTYNYKILTPMVSTFANSDHITIKANVSNTVLQAGTTCPSP